MTRPEIDRLINKWLDVLFDASQDAGFRGESVLAKMIEFGGEPPRGSGYYPPDVVMMAASQTQRPKPDGYGVINGTLQQMLRKRPVPTKAILLKNGYAGINPLTEKTYTNADRAWMLGIGLEEYRQALKVGYRNFSIIYADLRDYEAIRTV